MQLVTQMNAPALEQVKDFIAENARVDRRLLSATTSLFADLGIDGDDAHELIDAFSKRFHVDMARFVFADYFGPEAGFNPLVYMWRRLLLRSARKELTIRDLERAVSEKQW